MSPTIWLRQILISKIISVQELIRNLAQFGSQLENQLLAADHFADQSIRFLALLTGFEQEKGEGSENCDGREEELGSAHWVEKSMRKGW